MSTSGDKIHIKRVYDPPDKADGIRILVDRLWPRGLSKEKAKLTLWLKEIAPSSALRQWFGHDPAHFKEFGLQYRAELTQNGEAVKQVMDLLKQNHVTLLYAAHDPACNHALVLAGFIQDQLKKGHGHHSA